MKLWSEFYPDLLPELPGVPLPFLDHWILNVVIDFCDRSKSYVVDLTPAASVAEQMEYSPTLPANTELIEPKAIKFSGEPLTVKGRRELEQEFGDWESEIGTPVYWTQQEGDTILLVPAPAEATADAIKIKAALKPSLAATGIEDWLYSKWRMHLCAGVKAAMMVMADKPWSNPDRVQFNADIYEAAVSRATGLANSGNSSTARPRFSGSFC